MSTEPTPQDLAVAASISDYLTLGMHHATPDGRRAIAKIIARYRDEVELTMGFSMIADEAFQVFDREEASAAINALNLEMARIAEKEKCETHPSDQELNTIPQF